MQEKIKELKDNLKQKIKQQSKAKKIIILSIAIILLASCIITLSIQVIKKIQIK